MHRILVAVALVVFGVSLLGALYAGRTLGRTDAAKVFLPPPAPPDHRAVVGFAISVHHVDDIKPYLQAIDDLAAAGFNSVEIVTPAYQANGASSAVHVDEFSGAQRDVLVRLLRRIRERGMSAALMPIVLLEDPRGNEWRGKISPDDWDPWWKSYNDMLDHFLDVANDGGATAFSIGSELLTTEKMTDRWLNVIAKARSKFSGRLYYSTNWDHYDVPTFWKGVDMLGICCYWDLTVGTGTEKPGRAALAKRWAQIRKEVLSYAASQGRPVLFTELGYPSLPWGIKDPWNYVNPDWVPSAPEIQALGYSSYLEAWGDLLDRPYIDGSPASAPAERMSLMSAPMDSAPAAALADAVPVIGVATAPAGTAPDTSRLAADRKVAGVYFYEWDPWGTGGKGDTGYGVKGKPAYDLLKNWLATPAQP